MKLDETTNDSGRGSGGRLVAVDGRELPLRSVDLEVEATGGLARVVLTQRFRNPYDEPLHVSYRLPLPADGAVSGFSFVLGEATIVGEVRGRADARERFESAVAEGKTAALIEQETDSLFTQEIGNVPPGQELLAEIIVDQPLKWLAEGAWEWRFPTVVGPRYTGSRSRTASSVVDIADVDIADVDIAERDTGVRATLSLTIGDEVSRVDSPTHETSVRDGRVTFGGDRGVALDRDIAVRWEVARAEVGASLSTSRSARPELPDAHGLLTLVPPESGAAAAMKRDLIFLIDVSGSMGGRPLQQAKRLSLRMLDTLGSEDTVELIAFGSTPVRFRKDALIATRDGKRAAAKWIQKLRASGGTEMGAAILEALTPLRDDSQRQVVLITDGWIGFEQQVISEVANKLPKGARLHVVGVGSAPNRTLTQGASRAGNGVEVIAGLDEDVEQVGERLLERTVAPVVTDVVVEGTALRDMAPARVPDLYRNSPSMLSVRLNPEGGTLRVRGRTAEGDYVHTVNFGAVRPGEGNQAFAARFGRERVEDLEMKLSAGGDFAAIDRDIEETGVAYQIGTRCTSWIAVTAERTVDGPGRHETMPHELPYGTSIEGLGLRGGGLRAADEWVANVAVGSAYGGVELAEVADFEDARMMRAPAPPMAKKKEAPGAGRKRASAPVPGRPATPSRPASPTGAPRKGTARDEDDAALPSSLATEDLLEESASIARSEEPRPPVPARKAGWYAILLALLAALAALLWWLLGT
ncbi:MAG: VIT domain-containing protein [Myxococcota bacterium]